jgi:hypothetical protein
MGTGVRRAAAVLFVAVGAVWVAWLGFRTQTTGDYQGDYAPAMNALLAGHVGAFFEHLPTNGAGGSLLLRAPAALAGKLLLGGQLAIFRFGALACMIVVGGLGLVLARGMRAAGSQPVARVAVIGLCLAAPAILDAIFFGHPEEPLGAALCVGAVLLAADGRSTLAGVVLGLAVINKPWGVLAIAPVLLAARGGRVRLAVVAGSIGAAWVASAWLASPAHFGRIVLGASTSVVAHPVDLWWPFAHLHTAAGVTPAYFPPRLISDHARELAVLLSIPLSIPLARRPERSVDACLALLALLFLGRCALDPSNHVYYQVPLVIALVAWEARSSGAPVLALLATAAFWLTFHTVSGTGSLNAQYAAYLATVLPLAAVLARPAMGKAAPALGLPRGYLPAS